MTPKLPLTGDTEADELLENDSLALLIGMLLDQQVPMEKAFHSPYELKERLGGTLDAAAIAAMDPDQLAGVFSERLRKGHIEFGGDDSALVCPGHRDSCFVQSRAGATAANEVALAHSAFVVVPIDEVLEVGHGVRSRGGREPELDGVEPIKRVTPNRELLR